MAKRMASYFPQGAKLGVRAATLVHGVENGGVTYAELGAPLATSANMIIDALSVAAGATSTALAATFLASEAQMTRFGRGLRVVLSGAGTGTVTVRGRDYLQQYMAEEFALAGTTPVNGKKAFRYIDSVTFPTVGAVTMSVGVTDILGLPYKFLALDTEFKNQAAAANAGTFVAGLANGTASTATTADVRGTYLPVTVIPNGVNTFSLRYFIDNVNAHGSAQYFA